MKVQVEVGPSELERVARAFEDMLETLPRGCASLQQREEGKRAPAEVALIPVNERSAKFGAMFFDSKLYGAFFGREPFLTTYESPWDFNLHRTDAFEKQLVALKKMCNAVAAGKCEHRASMFSVLGIIRSNDGGMFRVCDVPVFHPKRARTRIIYESYYPDSPRASPESV